MITTQYTISIYPTNAPEMFIRNGQRLKRETEIVLEKTLDDVARFAEDSIRGAAPVGSTGDLRGSVDTRASRFSREIGPNAEYAVYVERGRGPGFPPPVRGYHGLARWAEFKGKTAGEAYAIAKAIGNRGVLPTWFVKSQVPKIENQFARLTERATEMIAGFVVS